jgi:hypothetical protein
LIKKKETIRRDDNEMPMDVLFAFPNRPYVDFEEGFEENIAP